MRRAGLTLLTAVLSVASAAAQLGGPGVQPAPPPAQPGPPPLPAAQGEAIWHAGIGGVSQGPFTVAQLIQKAQGGEISRDTQVWKQGMAAWALITDVPELQAVVAAIPARGAGGPPPMKQTQQQLDEKLKKFLVGTWRFDGPVSQAGYTMMVTIEITYREDGSYAGFQTVQYQGSGGMTPPPVTSSRIGIWRITSIDDTNFVLTVTERGQGAAEIKLRIIDENTVEDQAQLNRSIRVR